MKFDGVLPEDAPDPRIAAGRRLLNLPFPILGLTSQPTVENTNTPATAEVTDAEGRSHLAVSLSYTLWRNPEDRADPVNLKDLTPHEQAAIDDAPPWPRPSWLIDYVQMMRYPQLWEAVRTTWNRDVSEYTAPVQQLVDHTNYILMNHFREELGLSPGPTEDGPWQVDSSSANPATTLQIDGKDLPAFEIDTDPFVYAIGAQVRQDVFTTVVIAREHLTHVRLTLSTQNPTNA